MKKTIAILNTKGGASKSTVALQVAAAYFLHKKEDVDLIEFDDENKDSTSFNESSIRTKQVKVGDGKDISQILRETLLDKNLQNIVLDVGGNKTTTIFISGLQKSSLYNKIDLIIIPTSGGEQDTKNAVKTYDLIKDFKIPVIFALSRVTNVNRLKWKYKDFFLNFPNEKYIILHEGDVVELSRQNKQSIYEIAIDKDYLYLLDQELVKAFASEDLNRINDLSIDKELLIEADEYLKNTLQPAWEVLDEFLTENNVCFS